MSGLVKTAVAMAAALALIHGSSTADEGSTARAFTPTPLSEPRYEVVPPRSNPEAQSHIVTAHDGVELFVETWLPGEDLDGDPPPERIPTVLVMTPYTMRGEVAYLDLIEQLVPRGYAVAQHHVRGTGESGGCLEQTEPDQIDDGARVVEYLGRDAPWSNGSVGMYGISYDAETQISVAGLGDPERTSYLKAIIPVASVGGGYEYVNFDGVPYAGAGLANAAFYLQDSLTTRPASPANMPRMLDRAGCQPDAFLGYSSIDGDMTPFFAERELRPGAPNIRAATLMVHGHADWNVRPITAAGFFDRIPDATPHKGVFGVWEHNFPSGHQLRPEWNRADWLDMVTAWFDRYLLGLPTGVEDWPAVQIQGTDGVWRAEPSWPTTGGPVGHLALGANGTLGSTAPSGSTAYMEASAVFDDVALGQAAFTTAALPDRLHITGQPVLDLWVVLSQPDAHIALTLETFDASGRPIVAGTNYGFRSARHLQPLIDNTFAQTTGADPPVGTPIRISVRMFPSDLVIPAGGHLRLSIAGVVRSGGDPSMPSGATGTVTILHDCAHPSALRFLMARANPDLLNVREMGEDPFEDEPTIRPIADGGGIATTPICGAAPERLSTFGAEIAYEPPA